MSQAVEVDNWDAAQRLLEAIVRDPTNVQRISKIVGDDAKAHEVLLTLVREQGNMAKVGAWIEEQKALAIQDWNYRQAEWNNAVMSCGHVRKYRVPTGSVEEFVADAEKYGKCVVCEAASDLHHVPVLLDWIDGAMRANKYHLMSGEERGAYLLLRKATGSEEAKAAVEVAEPQPCVHNWLDVTDLIDRGQGRRSMLCSLCSAQKQERVPCLEAADMLD